MLDLNYALTLVFGGLLILALVIIDLRSRGEDNADKNELPKKALDAFLKLVRLLKG